MTSKETILQSIRQFKPSNPSKLPNFDHFVPTSYEDLLEQFRTNLENAGGEIGQIEDEETLEQAISRIFPNAKNIASKIISLANIDPKIMMEPHGLSSLDLAVVKGEFGVAENGAVWIRNLENYHRSLYFLAKNLVVVVPKNELVSTMHEAYRRIDFSQDGFGVFIAGLSKSSDIDQFLTTGVHGTKSVILFFV